MHCKLFFVTICHAESRLNEKNGWVTAKHTAMHKNPKVIEVIQSFTTGGDTLHNSLMIRASVAMWGKLLALWCYQEANSSLKNKLPYTHLQYPQSSGQPPVLILNNVHLWTCIESQNMLALALLKMCLRVAAVRLSDDLYCCKIRWIGDGCTYGCLCVYGVHMGWIGFNVRRTHVNR